MRATAIYDAPIAPRISILSGLLVAFALAACGGGGDGGNDGETAKAPTTSTEPAQKAAYGLGPHLVAPGELPGFAPTEIRSSKKPIDWLALGGLAPEGFRKEARRLRKLGFVAGANEQLKPGTESLAQGVSVVERFRSSAAAKSELATQVGQTKASAKGSFEPFPVPDIPGARGFALPGRKSSGYNVAFADGAYYHLIGAGWREGETHPPKRESVIEAAQRVYKRLHSKPSAS